MSEHRKSACVKYCPHLSACCWFQNLLNRQDNDNMVRTFPALETAQTLLPN